MAKNDEKNVGQDVVVKFEPRLESNGFGNGEFEGEGVADVEEGEEGEEEVAVESAEEGELAVPVLVALGLNVESWPAVLSGRALISPAPLFFLRLTSLTSLGLGSCRSTRGCGLRSTWISPLRAYCLS